MIARQKISLKEKEKRGKSEKALTPLEKAMLEAAEKDKDGASGGGGEKGSKKKRRPKSRGASAAVGSARGVSGKAGRAAVEGWLKNAEAANAEAPPAES